MMTPAKKIDPPTWLRTEALRTVMAALNNGDGFSKALVVGGAVRNVLVGKAVHDIDIATQHTPDQVIALLSAVGVKTIPTGIDHGTVTAVFKGQSFEVTTLRRDVETDGRHAVVAFTKSWGEDAQRRDFTMNTLLCDLEGQIYDPTGQGLPDLEARKVVFVGKAAERIAEDYLRILRFFRFHGTYGTGAPDEDALQACAAAAVHVLKLSRERITQEFLKILAVDKSVGLLALMQKNNVLTPLFDKNYKAEMMDNLAVAQLACDAVSIMARLVVLGGFSAHYETIRDEYLMLSNVQKKEYAQLLQMMKDASEATENNVKIMAYKSGADCAVQALLLKNTQHPIDGIEQYVQIAKEWDAPTFPLNGHDVRTLGVPDGPRMGEILSQVEEWWMAQGFAPSRDDCLEKLGTFTL